MTAAAWDHTTSGRHPGWVWSMCSAARTTSVRPTLGPMGSTSKCWRCGGSGRTGWWAGVGSLLCAVIELLYDSFMLKAIVWCQFVMFDVNSILLPWNRHPLGQPAAGEGGGDGPGTEQCAGAA